MLQSTSGAWTNCKVRPQIILSMVRLTWLVCCGNQYYDGNHSLCYNYTKADTILFMSYTSLYVTKCLMQITHCAGFLQSLSQDYTFCLLHTTFAWLYCFAILTQDLKTSGVLLTATFYVRLKRTTVMFHGWCANFKFLLSVMDHYSLHTPSNFKGLHCRLVFCTCARSRSAHQLPLVHTDQMIHA